MEKPAAGGIRQRAVESSQQPKSTAVRVRRQPEIDERALYLRTHELLSFDPATGEFRWRSTRGPMRAGKAAGNVGSCGRRFIGIDGKHYRSDALVLLATTGTWPNGVVLHLDGDLLDDRPGNLRMVPLWAATPAVVAELPAWAAWSLAASFERLGRWQP